MLDTSRHEGLAPLTEFAFPVYVSPSLEAAARPIAQRCERAYRFLSDTLQVAPAVTLRVLSEVDWAEYADSPTFGMPHIRRNTLIVAGEPGAFWQTK